MYQSYGLFIDGGWRAASDRGTAPVISPVTGEPLGDCPVATVDDTDEALDCAVRAQVQPGAPGAPSRAPMRCTQSPTR